MHLKKFLFIPIIALTSCSSNTILESKVFCFDSRMVSKLFEGNKEDLDTIDSIFNKLDALTDNYRSRDVKGVYLLNQSSEEIAVDPLLYDVLYKAYEAKDQGGFYFNPLTGSLSKKWKESLKSKQILDNSTIQSELNKLQNSDILFKNDYVVQRVGDAEIDLGGIAKGYALDKIKEYLDSKNYQKYLIDAGSSSILLGKKDSSDSLFDVGIGGLENSYLKLKDCFVSSSGTANQGVVIDGKTYSHIVNPYTGSVLNNYDAIITISDKGYFGDYMATSMMMNSIEEIKVIDTQYNLKTIAIKNGQVVYKNEALEILKH